MNHMNQTKIGWNDTTVHAKAQARSPCASRMGAARCGGHLPVRFEELDSGRLKDSLPSPQATESDVTAEAASNVSERQVFFTNLMQEGGRIELHRAHTR